MALHTHTFLLLASTIIFERNFASTVCESESCESDVDIDLHEVSLLQSKMVTESIVTKEADVVKKSDNMEDDELAYTHDHIHEEEEQSEELVHHTHGHDEHARQLLSQRGRRRRRKGFFKKVSKSVKSVASDVADTATDVADTVSDTAGTVSDTAGDVAGTVSDTAGDVADTVTDTANLVAEYAQQAADAAQGLLDDAVAAVKDADTFKKLLPACLQSGSLNDCQDIPSTDFISTRVSALESAMSNISSCFDLSGLEDVIKDVKCSSDFSIKYPTSVKMTWTPEIVTSESPSICSGMSGLKLGELKTIGNSAKTCGKSIYNGIANTISSVVPTGNCECAASFGIYFGAGAGGAVVVSAGLSAGFVMGCDGCNFKIKGWWAWQVGLTSNVAADVAAIIGYANTWDGFWGMANVVEASAGPNVVAANVGVGLSVPEITIDWESEEIKKEVCVVGQCATASLTLSAPKKVTVIAPQFCTIDFAISAGLSILPADATLGLAKTYKIDL